MSTLKIKVSIEQSNQESWQSAADTVQPLIVFLKCLDGVKAPKEDRGGTPADGRGKGYSDAQSYPSRLPIPRRNFGFREEGRLWQCSSESLPGVGACGGFGWSRLILLSQLMGHRSKNFSCTPDSGVFGQLFNGFVLFGPVDFGSIKASCMDASAALSSSRVASCLWGRWRFNRVQQRPSLILARLVADRKAGRGPLEAMQSSPLRCAIF